MVPTCRRCILGCFHTGWLPLRIAVFPPSIPSYIWASHIHVLWYNLVPLCREKWMRGLYWDVANQILCLRNMQFRPRDCIQSTLFFFLIRLHWVLVGTCRIFTAACWIFSCSLWDPASWPGIEPGPLHWECRVLATGSPGKSLLYFLEWNNVTLGSGAAYPCAARLVEAGLQRKAEGNEADFAKKRRNQGP